MVRDLAGRFTWLERLESQDYLRWGQWLIVAALVGLGRLVEEFFLVYLPRGEGVTFNVAVNYVTFYAQLAWLYAAAASILTGLGWRRTLGPALAGTLAALLPPLVDAAIYGAGRFNYFYQFDYPGGMLRLMPVDLGRGIPFAEVIVAYGGACLLASYVGGRTRSLTRATLALVTGYGLIQLWGGILPTLAARLNRHLGLDLLDALNLVQTVTVVAIYFGLNPELFRQTARRLAHILPAPLLVLLGAAIGHHPVGAGVAVALSAGLVSASVVQQNDYFDRQEDIANGRLLASSRHNVRFSQAILVLLLVVVSAYRFAPAGLLLVFVGLTLLYHHPRFRWKRRLVLSFLIEGACAASMVAAGLLAASAADASQIVWLGPAVAFLAFALGCAFKDYKDIDGDQAAGNETVYTVARKQGWSIPKVQRIVTLFLVVLTVAPIPWLRWRGVPLGVCLVLALGACTFMPLILLRVRHRVWATEAVLWLVNAYLLAYGLLVW